MIAKCVSRFSSFRFVSRSRFVRQVTLFCVFCSFCSCCFLSLAVAPVIFYCRACFAFVRSIYFRLIKNVPLDGRGKKNRKQLKQILNPSKDALSSAALALYSSHYIDNSEISHNLLQKFMLLFSNIVLHAPLSIHFVKGKGRIHRRLLKNGRMKS